MSFLNFSLNVNLKISLTMKTIERYNDRTRQKITPQSPGYIVDMETAIPVGGHYSIHVYSKTNKRRGARGAKTQRFYINHTFNDQNS